MIPERIADRIAEPDENGCWLWLGHALRGYGQANFERREQYVHRIVYSLLIGPIPEGFEVDHLCRVRRCCNPDHLEAVTPAENRRRANAAKPKKAYCLRGHARTPDNTTASMNCRKCAQLRYLAHRPPAVVRDRPTHCPAGHEYTPENTYSPPSQPTKRHCRICKRVKKREAARARAEVRRHTTTPEENA